MTRALAAMIVALTSLGGCSPSETTGAAKIRPNILIVTIDTFRADRVARGWTPTLDRVASQGLRFTNARSVVPLTLPAHASIFTGQLPSEHGTRLNGMAWTGGTASMAARLRAAGYQTAAVVGAFVLDRRFGLAAGFDRYDDRITRDPRAMDRLQAERPASVVVDHALASLAALTADRPWLLWVHLYDPHAPYDPPADARARAGGDAYNGEVAYVDAELSRLLAAVESRTDAAHLATVVTGDHGEGLGDHGEPTHGMLLFDSTLRVPLTIKAPGVTAAERSDAASSIDVLPTVLALAGLPADGLAGRSLVGAPRGDVEIYGETDYPSLAGWTPLRSLVQDRWKLLMADKPWLFDLHSDPGEATDVAAARQATVGAMVSRLDEAERAGARAAPSSTATVASETSERLRALGYVAPGATPVTRGTTGINPALAVQAWASYERAQSALTEGHAVSAARDLARLVTDYPDSRLFASTHAKALGDSGQPTEALARYRAAIKRWPTDADLFHDLAVLARDRGLRREAMRAEDAALVLNPALASAHNGRGLLLVDEGHHDAAAIAFREATRLDPTNGAYHANLGNARRALLDLDGAERAYVLALEHAPDLADAANGLGVILVQRGRAAEAIHWLEQAASDSTFVEAQLNLGIAFQESAQLARAKAQYRKVIQAKGSHTREREAARALLAQLGKR